MPSPTLAEPPRIVAGAGGTLRDHHPRPRQDSWDAVYLGGAKIGYVHTWVEKVNDKGRDYNRVRIDIEQRLKRRDDEALIKLMYGTIETLDGEVLRLDTRTQAGETQDIRVHGDAINGKMKLTMDGMGRGESRTIAWGPDVRGPYGAEQSMAASPWRNTRSDRSRCSSPS